MSHILDGQTLVNLIEAPGKPEAKAEDLIEAMNDSHRTHQQNFMSFIKLFIAKYAEQAYDARNQASVEWAREVAKLPNSDLRFPYI